MNSSKGNPLLRTCIHRNDESSSVSGKTTPLTPVTNIAGDKLSGCSPSQSSSTGESQQGPISTTTVVKDVHIGPAKKPVWKGDFEIKDSPSNMAFCEGVIAHPSAKVSRRAYSFAQQLSKVLQFRVYARTQFLPHIFDGNCPSRDDIALYFYPSKTERSKNQYAQLLKFMKRNGFMLRSRIGGLELLVFPSSVLDNDSSELNGSYFMWGVFLLRKREVDAPVVVPLPTSIPTPIPRV